MTKSVISSDSHVVEPSKLWTSRLASQYRERSPYVLRGASGDRWHIEGDVDLGSIGIVVSAGKRYEDPSKISRSARLEDIPRGGYDPNEHIRDMALDGVDAELVYPSIGLRLYGIPDAALLSAICRTYNDWVAEFCSSYPDRLKGIAMVNVDDVDEGIAEIKRVKQMGFSGAMISVYPQEDRQYDHLVYEPLWATAQDLDLPLSLHAGTNRYSSTHRPGPGEGRFGVNAAAQSPKARVNMDHWVRMSVASMVFSGVFERYPALRVVVVEHELAWVPFFLRIMDFTYRERVEDAKYRFKGNTLPSDFFHRNVYLSFQEDDLGIRDRSIIGVDNLMWGSDYPHAESTFPKSRETLARILTGVPEGEKAKIVGGNAARLYHME